MKQKYINNALTYHIYQYYSFIYILLIYGTKGISKQEKSTESNDNDASAKRQHQR